jgi:hypothetical protein
MHSRFSPRLLLASSLLACGVFAHLGCAHADELPPRSELPPNAYLGESQVHPLEADTAKHTAICAALPPGCRDHLYVFIVNGLDPFGWGNLRCLSCYIRSLGYHTHYSQMYQYRTTLEEIHRVHHEDPQARFVLIGFSGGSYNVVSLINQMRAECINVDLVIYMAGDYLRDRERVRPDNVCRVVNITSHGLVFSGYDLLFNGAEIQGARNMRLCCRHILVPSRCETIDALVEELAATAAACPVVAVTPPVVAPQQIIVPAPAPGKVTPAVPTKSRTRGVPASEGERPAGTVITPAVFITPVERVTSSPVGRP